MNKYKNKEKKEPRRRLCINGIRGMKMRSVSAKKKTSIRVEFGID